MRKLLFLAVCLTVATYAHAQVAFNPKVGLNFSRITSEAIQLSEDGVKAGLNIGLDLRVGGSDSWVFFQPGIHYYNVGSRVKARIVDQSGADEVETEVDDILNAHTLKVPMNAGVYLTGPETTVRVRLNGGVVPTFLLGLGSNDVKIEADDFKSVTWGLNGGLGFDFSIVTLDFNYEHGLSDIIESVDAINAPNVNGRNRMFTLSLGVVL